MTESIADPSRTHGSVRVVGTAHISAESVETVERTIRESNPDVVAVELDEGRFRQLRGETPEDLDARDLLRGNTVFQFLAYWLLSYVQARLGDQFDIKPGADMLAAVESAEAIGVNVALVDRDIQTTIQRFWAKMTFREKVRLLWELALAMIGIGDGDDEIDLADFTKTDVVTAMLEEFRRFSPGGAEALIDERDAYIANHLVRLRDNGLDVVAVVGAGHRAGIEAYLADPASLPTQASLTSRHTKRFSVYKLLGYVFTLGFLAFFILLAMSGARNTTLLSVFGAWFLFNGVIAFGLARLAGAHWPSAIVGGAIAWLTSVNPLLAPGWFAGYVELRYLTVNVADIGQLNELLADEESPVRTVFSRMLDVPLFRLVVIVAATNIGSMIATFLFPFVVLPLLGPEVGSVGAISDRMVEGATRSAELIWGAVT